MLPRWCQISERYDNLNSNPADSRLNDILSNWDHVTHVCVSKLTIIGSDNGWLLSRRRAIIWINSGILLTRPLTINFSEILIEIHIFSPKKMHLKWSSAKWRPFCLGLDVLQMVRVISDEFHFCYIRLKHNTVHHEWLCWARPAHECCVVRRTCDKWSSANSTRAFLVMNRGIHRVNCTLEWNASSNHPHQKL